MDNLEYDILLAYSLGDSSEAYELASALSDAGLRVWFDQWEIIPGDSWAEALEQALATSGIICACVGTGDPIGEKSSGQLLLKQAQTSLLLPILLPGAHSGGRMPAWSPLRAIDLREAFRDEVNITLALGRLTDVLLEVKGKAVERPQTLTAMNNIAEASRALGELAEAHALHEKVLNIRKRVLGKEHPETLASINNLAGVLSAEGNLKEAQKLLEGALEVTQKALDKEQGASGLSGLVERGLSSFFGRESSAQVAATAVKEITPKLRGNLYGTLSAQGKLVRQDRQKALIDLAREILSGKQASPLECLNLTLELKKERAFGYARRILAQASKHLQKDEDPKLWRKLIHQLALCTYKDPELLLDLKLNRALDILALTGDLQTTTDPETLGLAGAINQRMWEVDGQLPHLLRALLYHQRGYRQGIEVDFGYNAIHTAFLLDLLASLEVEETERAGGEAGATEQRRAEARRIREEIIWQLPPMAEREGYEWLTGEWWYYSTIGEAYFGLQHYEQAAEWLVRRRPPELRVPEWEYESTARQLAWLARMQSDVEIEDPAFTQTEAWGVLQEFLGDDATAVRSAFVGKIGLALSGGGFRASLFHIGVLARLAELDVLRHVEVLSCVSGGSIIGTYYYLELRKLLQEKEDGAIARDDYIQIVERMERDFLAGVQRNVRSRVTASLFTNLRMLFQPDYSRTLRAGELYESEIFARVADGGGDRPRWLNQLTVQPKGAPENFMPQYDNWLRAAKVPTLIINATTLNTGHNWQFTAGWMGESPASIETEVDSNDRLRRMRYGEAPPAYRRMRLGHAVAASASVPGLFQPLVLPGLYPERVVELIDGSFRDGQGMLALLEQDCNVILTSDATGHIESDRGGTAGVLVTFFRAIGILVSSLREANYHELRARRISARLRGLMYVHLKKDIDIETVNWIGCSESLDDLNAWGAHGVLTGYGILKSSQKRLAEIRADFDSYSEAEAYSLMTSGYRMTEREFPSSIKGFPGYDNDRNVPWKFLEIEPVLNGEKGTEKAHEELLKLLDAAKNLQFKALALSLPLRVAAIVVGLAALAALSITIAWGLFTFSAETLAMVLKVTVAVLAIAAFVMFFLFSVLRRKPVDYLLNLFIIAIGFPAALFRLLITDKVYLRRGTLRRLLNLSKPPDV
jgi:predicted acylesterase/phospholipase RssA